MGNENEKKYYTFDKVLSLFYFSFETSYLQVCAHLFRICIIGCGKIWGY
jgi:hypothetical protein